MRVNHRFGRLAASGTCTCRCSGETPRAPPAAPAGHLPPEPSCRPSGCPARPRTWPPPPLWPPAGCTSETVWHCQEGTVSLLLSIVLSEPRSSSWTIRSTATWERSWQGTAAAPGWPAELHFFWTEGVQEWSALASESPTHSSRDAVRPEHTGHSHSLKKVTHASVYLSRGGVGVQQILLLFLSFDSEELRSRTQTQQY